LIGVGQQDLALPAASYYEFRPWTEQTEVAELQHFDVGVMPLPDSPWERGKCGYKLVQYLGCGKPVIASPVGANRWIVEQGANGFLAETPEEWKAALSTLLREPGLRSRFGQAGRTKVEREFCIQVNGPKLVATLREAVA
jgi:hypothetical protein